MRFFLKTTSPIKSKSCERGIALVEFAIIVPVLFAIIFGGIELARALRVQKMVSTMSREVANIAFRECTPALEPVQACLENVVERVVPLSSPGMSEVIVIVSVYRVNPVTGFVEQAGTARGFADASDPEPNLQSRICLSGCLENLNSSLVRDAGMIAVGEVYSRFTPIVGIIPNYLWFNPERLYEATVF
jgi:hypothetical protein